MSRTQSAYYAAFICAVLLCFSPSKAAGYAAPAVAIGIYCVMAGSTEVIRRLAIGFVCFLLYVAVFGLANTEFRFLNAMMALLTYSGILVIVVIPSRGRAGPVLNEKTRRVATVVLLIEAAVGIVQSLAQFIATRSFDSSNGDHVQGTIHLGLDTDGAFANAMFAINMTLLTLYLWSCGPRGGARRRVVIGLAVFVVLLASVLHLTALAIVAFFLGTLFGMTGKKALIHLSRVVVFGTVAIGLLTVLTPGNLGTFAEAWRAFSSGRSVRMRMIQRVLLEMPRDYPLMPFVGLGLGQFNSRAALMCTGRYFVGAGGQSAAGLLPVTEMSPAQDSYFRDLWESNMMDTSYSAIVKPYFSWMSVYTELGTAGLICAAVAFSFLLRRIWSNRWKNSRLAIALAGGCLLLALLGSQENYWEVPQAILAGLMLLKLIHANLLEATSNRAAVVSGSGRVAISQIVVPALPPKPAAALAADRT